MEPTTRVTWTTGATVIVVLLAGLIALVLLVPAAVLHSNPPRCLSTFGYRVPCGQLTVLAFRLAEWSLAASAATAGAVSFALRSARRR